MAKRTLYLLLAICLSVGMVPASLVFAASSNKLIVNPASSQMNINSNLILNVKSYSSGCSSSCSAKGTINYNSNLLQVTGVSTGGSDYGAPSISQHASSIDFDASRTPPEGDDGSGFSQIFAITFTARAAGTASVTFSNGTVNGSTADVSNGSFTIIDPNPKEPSSPPPKHSPSPVPVITTPVTPPADTASDTPPTPDPTGTVNSVIVTPRYSSSTITWKVNAPNPTSTISYGASSSQSDKKGVVQQKPDGTFMAVINGLTPGLHYSFTITGSGTGVSPGTYSQTFTTQGFPVTISISENKTPVKSARLAIAGGNHAVTSNKITLGLAAGSYSGTITTDTASLSINLTVVSKKVPADGTAPETQSFAFNLTSSPIEGGPGSSFSIFAFVGVLVGGAVILTLGFLIFINYRRRQFELDGGYSQSKSSSTVVIEDGYDWHHEDNNPNTTQQAPPEPPAPDGYPGSEVPPETPAHQHANSVYLSEEEPVDMFDQSKISLPPIPGSSPQPPVVPPQNPNSPHSTTP